MVVEVSTELLASADRVWEQVRRPSTAGEISKGLLGLRSADDLPPTWRAGDVVHVRLWLLHVLPMWRQEISIVRSDGRELVLETEESGGPLREWRHRIAVEQSLGPRSRYVDRIELRAGAFTPVMWLSVQALLRWRQYRWRRLARTL